MRSLFIVVLIFALLNVGCATPASYATAGGGDSAVSLASGGSHIGVDGSQHANHRQVRGGDRWPLWVAAGILITAVVVLDLLILPATYHDPFPCSRGVISWCH